MKRKPIPEHVLREARVEAVRQLVNRERLGGLEAMGLALARASMWRGKLVDEKQRGRYVVDKNGNVIPGGCMDAERTELHDELARIRAAIASTGECALDGEDFDEALRRVLLERGVSAYQLRETLYAGNDSKRTAAGRAKSALLEEYRDEAALIRAISAISKRMGVPAPFSAARCDDIQPRIGILSLDLKKQRKKPKSSSRKRR